MTISPDTGDNLPIKVIVKTARGGNIASKLTGVFFLRGKEFKFRALAYGRIGGHNISLNMSKSVLKEIKSMGLDSEMIYLRIQRKLIEGDVELKEKVPDNKLV